MSSGFYSRNGRWPDPKSSKQKGGAGYFPNLSSYNIQNVFSSATNSTHQNVRVGGQDRFAVPYSSTPPATGTKVMDWMPYLAAVSRRTKLAHVTTEIFKRQWL